jgi:hypothetical protein
MISKSCDKFRRLCKLNMDTREKSMIESDLYADVGGLREWQRASAQQKGELVEEVVRVREPEHRAKVMFEAALDADL